MCAGRRPHELALRGGGGDGGGGGGGEGGGGGVGEETLGGGGRLHSETLEYKHLLMRVTHMYESHPHIPPPLLVLE